MNVSRLRHFLGFVPKGAEGVSALGSEASPLRGGFRV